MTWMKSTCTKYSAYIRVTSAHNAIFVWYGYMSQWNETLRHSSCNQVMLGIKISRWFVCKNGTVGRAFVIHFLVFIHFWYLNTGVFPMIFHSYTNNIFTLSIEDNQQESFRKIAPLTGNIIGISHGRHGVSNHRQLFWLFNWLLGLTMKQI